MQRTKALFAVGQRQTKMQVRMSCYLPHRRVVFLSPHLPLSLISAYARGRRVANNRALCFASGSVLLRVKKRVVNTMDARHVGCLLMMIMGTPQPTCAQWDPVAAMAGYTSIPGTSNISCSRRPVSRCKTRFHVTTFDNSSQLATDSCLSQ